MSLNSWKLSVVLSLLLLVPRAGLAEPFPRTELPASLHLLEDLAEPASAEPADNPALRIVLAVGSAVVTSSLMAVGGYQLGNAICSDELLCTEPFFGVLVGMTLGASLGTWWGGALADGRGSLWGAMVGSGVGMLASGVIYRVLGLFSSGTHPLVTVGYAGAYAMVSLFTVAGAVTGYEIAHRMSAPAEATAPAPALQPLVSVTSRGAALGLGGSF